MRLDQFLVQRGDFRSRERAAEAVRAETVLVNSKVVGKPAFAVEEGDTVEVTVADFAYVSRGGLKLEAALKEFRVEAKGLVCLDIGVATGGFSDCLLRNSAQKVYAVDIGKGQLEPDLLLNKKLFFRNETDARDLEKSDFQENLDLIAIDVSFISITLLFDSLKRISTKDTKIIALIKPQFEYGSRHPGVFKDTKVVQEILKKLRPKWREAGFEIIKEMPSPILGKEGNQEFLWLIRNSG
jgi:23S rRNA (cytidine1920-2'-O)/16S rRNA (cytidine1409-2'-O)-methyltransferase